MNKYPNRRRFNTAIPQQTYDYLKEFADRYCMTMGSAVAVIVEQYRMQQNVSQGFAAISADRGINRGSDK